ncbi:MAG: TIGR04076 family protein [Candidatus Bathyarchaeota archaeon]|nr:MAG: TIGR04076 family protein [Candidatus Bathyarchaeota archaeon]
MKRMKITVVKGYPAEEVFRGNTPDHFPENFESPCPMHTVGQEFVMENLNCPEGFCNWAYADIQKDLVNLYFGTNYYRVKKANWVSCTDGMRPVVFKIEKIEE